MKRFVSYVTGCDPVTRFRDFETISAPETAFSGGTPSRGLASGDGGDLARPLCLLAKTHKARLRLRLRRGMPAAGGRRAQKCFFAKARPDWLLRYFSKAAPLDLSRKATAVSIRQGANFDVWATLSPLWAFRRSERSCVMPTYQ